MVDHINGNKLDNRRENLRNTTRSANQHNRKIGKNNASGVSGVHWCNTRNRWIARGVFNSKHIYLGAYLNTEDAVSAIEEWREKTPGAENFQVKLGLKQRDQGTKTKAPAKRAVKPNGSNNHSGDSDGSKPGKTPGTRKRVVPKAA